MTRLIPTRLAISVTTLLLVACGGGASSDDSGSAAPPPDWVDNGRLVIIGGALAAENEAVYRAVVDGREGDGPLCVIPTASGDPDASMATAVERLASWSEGVPVHGIRIATDAPERATDPAVADSLRSCSGYFFTGGSQSRVMDVFRPGDGTTPAYDALMDRWREGAVVAGTSAGAAMMSTVSIAGGSSQSALESGIGANEDDEGLWIRRGMELVPWALVDQHFLARGRWARLVVATLAHPDPGLGVGIDENTALVVEGGVGEVAGASGVIWLDTRGGEGAAARGGRFTLLGRGDRVHILDGRVERAGTPLEVGASVGMAPAGATPGATPADSDAATSGAELLERWALLHALARMTAESAPLELEMGEWALTLSPAPGFQRLGDGGPGVEGAPGGLSVGPLELVARRSADPENP